ncbi:MAG: NAD(P)-binding protein [Pseudomonadota bacterium]|nr:NAD(P)-binding protein [Pseudomonadota bacterium]
MGTPAEEVKKGFTFLTYEEGDDKWDDFSDAIFQASWSHKCPVYVSRTPPCQGSCPSGHNIRGWLQIVRGIEKPPVDMNKYDYAFYRNADANPFPAIMGRVCPAPCQDGCNRNELEEFVGINSVEQFLGDHALESGLKFENLPELSGKKVAVVGGGPAGMAAAYQLRKLGHASTVFEARDELGGMMRYGIPNYRIPRDRLEGEMSRIMDMGGIEIRTGTSVGKDVSIADLEKDYDAILWALGCWTGRGLPAKNADAPNVVNAIEYLEAFNKGQMQVTAKRVVCVGGGDTSIDVVTVARRLGYKEDLDPSLYPEEVFKGRVVHDDSLVQDRKPNEVTLTAVFPRDSMTATEEEVVDALHEGVTILNEVMPLEVILDDNGRATGLKMAECTADANGIPSKVEGGKEFVIEADLIVSAIGQGGDLGDLDIANERGFIDADAAYQVPNRPGHFVAGDIIRPHLLTTAIGQARKAVESMDRYLQDEKPKKRPKVDVQYFDLMSKLQETDLAPSAYDHQAVRGTSDGDFAVHNYEDRSKHEIIKTDRMFLGHFEYAERHLREHFAPDANEVLGSFAERGRGLPEEEAVAESERCMSCGLCFECDNCVIFCPQDAVFRVKKDKSTLGRYVDTDYMKCIGCHICSDVCPTGYIDMAMGE